MAAGRTVRRGSRKHRAVTAKPAASSAALLMRKPEDNRSMDVCILSLALVAYVRAIKAPTLVLITVMI